MRTASTSFIERLRDRVGRASMLLLLEVEISDSFVLRFVKNNKSVEFPTGSGKVYRAYPILMENSVEDNAGNLNSVTISIANIREEVQEFIDVDLGLTGRTVRMIFVFSDNLGDAANAIQYDWTIQSASTGHLFSVFVLGVEDVYKAAFPVNRVLDNTCRHIFKDSRCGYSGALTHCPKNIAACTERGRLHRFGGFAASPIPSA